MTTKRVIAYGMDEWQLAAAAAELLTDARVTPSYVIGDIDEDRIHELAERGLLVDELARRGRPATAARVRGAVVPDEDDRRSGTGDEAAGPGTPQWLVSLDGPLLPGLRTEINATGVRLREYVPDHAYVVTATEAEALACGELPFVREVERYGAAVTAPVPLTAGEGRRGAADDVLAWDLWLTDAGVREDLLEWMAAHGVPVDGSGGRRIRIAGIADAELRQRISTLPGVLGMVEYVPPELFNDVSRQLLGVDGAGPADPGVPYTGRGQVVAVADTGLATDHPDFAGRIVAAVGLGRPGDASDPHGHGTHVAGSVLGDGRASGGRYRGVAPEARLYFQSLLDAAGGLAGLPVDLSELLDAAYAAGARIHNNSWGAATGSAYTVDANDVDAYIADHPDMLVVVAAGNEGTAAHPEHSRRGFVDWLSIASPASCKNALSVGAARSSRTRGGLAAQAYGGAWPDTFPEPPIAAERVSGDPAAIAGFSSRGPCDDRRLKPDVVAPGTDVVSARSGLAPAENFWGLVEDNPAYAYLGGTSMACPLVSGCAALVREYYVCERGVTPSAALLKATIINGTRWLDGIDAVADHGLRPNYHQGFGAVHLPTTLPGPAEPRLRLAFADTWAGTAPAVADTGERVRFVVEVAEGLPLRICLAYTDLPGRALQNDLSLLVAAPDGRGYSGNADAPGRLLRSDSENNVEVVRADRPVAGRWVIQVFARNLLRPGQDFALAVSGALTSDLEPAG